MKVRDPIHGFIEYYPTEEKVIGTNLFQRLRNIKQLALASYVYPGAHHTRFEHSIGTMHVAEKIAEKVGIDASRKTTLRLAALLHDIGHGPFSHVSEQVFERSAKELVKRYDADNAHELMSILLVEKHPEMRAVLKDKQIEEITRLLKKQPKKSLDKDIISGPLDADKLDYLTRDSYFAGVRYGVFDLDKVINSFVPIGMGSEGETLGIKEEGIHAVEQLLLAKYHMNIQVYQHRIRRITDAMLVRGISLALGDSLFDHLFIMQDSEEYVKKFSEYNDEVLLNEAISKGKGHALEYFQRIKERKLFKEVFSVAIEQGTFPDPVALKHLKDLSDPQQMKNIEQTAAQVFSDESHIISTELVIADKQSTSNPTFKSPGVKIDSNTIMVLNKDDKRQVFPSCSSVFRNTSIDPDTEALYIYLPLDWIKDKEKRHQYIKDKEQQMKDKIEELVR